MRVARAALTELEALFGEDTRSIWVSSPWVTGGGLALLETAMARSNTSLLWSFELWIRVDEMERVAGITDFAAIDAFLDRLEEEARDVKVSVFTSPRLHAKAILTDSGALVGSANLTGMGFGGNLEITVRLDREEAAAVATLRDALRPELRLVDRDAFRRFVRGTPLPGTLPTPKATSWEDFRERLLQGGDPGGIR